MFERRFCDDGRMDTPCTIAPGTRHSKGYRWAPGGKLAHRAAWEAEHGPIPAGAVVDHRCHNEDPHCPGGNTCPHRACDNVAHLQLSTSAANILDGINTRATCRSGRHPRNGPGECKACKAERMREWYLEHADDQRAQARERSRARTAAKR